MIRLWSCALIGALVLVAHPVPVGADDGIELEAVVDGEALADADFGNPLPLGDELDASVEATVINNGSAPVEIRRIRLEGTAFGVAFLAFDTVLPFTVEAGSSRTIAFELALDELKSQATGLLPATLAVYDVTGQKVAAQDFTVEVDGDATSVMGVFAILTGIITLLAVALNAYLIARRKLPPNRIVRGFRFLVPGLGLGLLITLLLAMGRIIPPYETVWPWSVALPAFGSFMLGYLSPGALDLTDDIDEFDVIEEPRYRT